MKKHPLINQLKGTNLGFYVWRWTNPENLPGDVGNPVLFQRVPFRVLYQICDGTSATELHHELEESTEAMWEKRPSTTARVVEAFSGNNHWESFPNGHQVHWHSVQVWIAYISCEGPVYVLLQSLLGLQTVGGERGCGGSC